MYKLSFPFHVQVKPYFSLNFPFLSFPSLPPISHTANQHWQSLITSRACCSCFSTSVTEYAANTERLVEAS